MADDHNPRDNNDSPYEPYDELDILNLMSDYNPSLVDFVFNNTPPPPPSPPPPSPLALPPIPDDSDMEVNQSLILSEPSHVIPNDGHTNNDQPLLSTCDMIDILSDDVAGQNMVDQFLKDIEDGGIDFDGDAILEVEDVGNDFGDVIVNVGEEVTLEVTNPVFDGSNFETGGPSTTPVPLISPIISPGIYVCSCCRLLRTIIHSNGREMMRLDLYGGNDSICHGIVEIQRFGDGTTERLHQTIHLKDLGLEDAQSFVEDYMSQREATRLPLVEDSFPSLFQAMNNQMLMLALPDIPMSLARPDDALNVPPVPLYVSLREEPPVVRKQKQRRQTALAAQRARTRKLTLKDLAPYFNIPIEEAARRLSICPTVAKKISRKGGLSRWPHRKMRSIHRKISTLQSELRYEKDPVLRAQKQDEIERLQKEIKDFCARILRHFSP